VVLGGLVASCGIDMSKSSFQSFCNRFGLVISSDKISIVFLFGERAGACHAPDLCNWTHWWYLKRNLLFTCLATKQVSDMFVYERELRASWDDVSSLRRAKQAVRAMEGRNSLLTVPKPRAGMVAPVLSLKCVAMVRCCFQKYGGS
jgi:hypothetical protein